jgi:hypothetical protein
VPDQLKIWIAQQRRDILLASCEEIVDAQDIAAQFD